MEYEITSEETILRHDNVGDQALALAGRIADLADRTQRQIIEFTGKNRDPVYDPGLPLARQPKKLRLGSLPTGHWSVIRLRENPYGRGTSYILDGVHEVILIVQQPINHLLLRQCRNVVVSIERGSTSGIDVLFGQSVGVDAPCHNWVNVEGTTTALIQGEIDDNTKIRITSSLDICVNGIDLPVNPFITIGHRGVTNQDITVMLML